MKDPHYSTPQEPPPWKDWVEIFCSGRKTTAFYKMSTWYCNLCGTRVKVIW